MQVQNACSRIHNINKGCQTDCIEYPALWHANVNQTDIYTHIFRAQNKAAHASCIKDVFAYSSSAATGYGDKVAEDT